MRKFTALFVIFLFLALPTGRAAAQQAQNTPISGTQTLNDDYEISIPPAMDTSAWGYAAVYAAQGEVIGILPDKTVTINLGDVQSDESTRRGILAFEGGEVVFDKTIINIDDTGNFGRPVIGIYASEGGHVTIGAGSEITISTEATGSSYGLHAENSYGDSDSRITTGAGTTITWDVEGGNAVNVYTDFGDAAIFLGDSNTINLTQAYSNAIWVNEQSYGDGKAMLTAGDYLKITASDGLLDGGWRGIEVWSENSLAWIGRSADISLAGKESLGISASSESSLKVGDWLSVNMGGDSSTAVYVDSGASVDIGDNARIVTNGHNSNGFYARRDNSSLMVGDNACVSADGNSSHGVLASGGASIDIRDNLRVRTGGNWSYGLYTASAIIIDHLDTIITTGNNLAVSTTGEGSHALYAVLDLRGFSARAETFRGTPAGLPDRSIIEVGERAYISTTGKDASAVHASGFNSFITVGSDANIVAAGEGSYAVLSHNGALTTLHGGTISVDMAHSPAAVAARTDLFGPEPFSDTVSGDSTVSGDGVFKIYGDIMAEFYDEQQFWYSDMLVGEGIGAALVDMKLQDGSYFYGATVLSGDKIISQDQNDPTSEAEELQSTFINLTMNGQNTLWKVTGRSELTNLNMGGNATIDYRSSDMGTIILTENFGSSGEQPVPRSNGASGGQLTMKTDIAAGLADQLWVSGTTDGSHLVEVYDSLSGNNTSDDTLILIQTADQGGSFKLTNNNRVTIGAFDYELVQETNVINEVNSDETGANWYLRGAGSSDPGSDGSNIFSAAYLLSYAETETLIKRLGDLRATPALHGFWARVHGGKFESNAKSYVKGFDMDYGGVHVGYDRKLENIGWDGDAYAGIMFGYSKGDLDYSSHGSGEIDSKMVGLYSTFVKENGFFLDLILKYQWMENEFSSFTADGTKVTGDSIDTGGFGLSFEVGQRISLGRGPKNGWYAEPQLQLSYMRQDGGTFYATDGMSTMRVGADGFTSIIGRIGLLMGYETEKSNLYFKVSRAREFDGDVSLMINDVPIKEDFGGSFWVYGLGYTAKLNDRNSIYLDVERTSGWTFRQAWSARLGWRMEF